MTFMMLLALAASASTPPSPSTPLTAHEEVEAWSPADDATVTSSPATPPVRDDAGQAVSLIAPVLIGTAIAGTSAVVVASLAGSSFFHGAPGLAAATYAIAAATMGAGPLVAVLIAGKDLPAWTPWLAGGLAMVGGSVAYAAVMVSALAIIKPARDDTLSYVVRNDGEAFALFFAPPILGLLVAGGSAVAATTLAAHAE